MLENALFMYAFSYMFERTGTGWCIIAMGCAGLLYDALLVYKAMLPIVLK